ncbi:radical SAM protein [Candidatus Microgenomates bacterium]|nr:radical SAM protein [Candidatus Microgenomates bacterium]
MPTALELVKEEKDRGALLTPAHQDRILFVVPPNITYENYVNPPSNVKGVMSKSKQLGTVVTDMPLGPLSLSAYVKEHTRAQTGMVDFNVVLNRIQDFDYGSFTELFRTVFSDTEWVEFNPTIIGISALFSPSYHNVLDIAECCRKLFPESIILGGGFLPTNAYERIFQDCPHFDGLCFGEGELALTRLVKAEDKKKHLESDPVWITPRKAKCEAKFGFDFVWKLDEIPFLDYRLGDPKGYALNPTIAAYPAIRKTGHDFHVMTSRGCVFHCAFCAQHTVHGRKMRAYSIERIEQDFRRLQNEFGVQTIIVEDDHFMWDKDQAHRILDIMIELQLSAFFPNSLALYALDRKMLEQLKRVGVNQLVLAVESGSREVLNKIMHKPLKLEIIARVAKDCREIGIYTDCNIVMGLPGEREEHFAESREFLKTTYANWFRINIATPIVGSEMLDICLANDYLEGDFNGCDYKRAIVSTPDFTAERIQKLAYLMNLELNFVYNSDFRLGDYQTALMGFENAIKAKSDHALAHYYAAQCHLNLNNPSKANEHLRIAKEAAKNPFWHDYVEMFGIAI